MVSIFKFLVREKWRDCFPEIFILFWTSLYKIFTLWIFANFNNLVSKVSVFLPVRFSIFLEFVTRHVSLILGFSKSRIHVRHWSWWDNFALDRSAVVNDILNKRTSKPRPVIYIIEDVHYMKWGTFNVATEVWFDKILVTSIVYSSRFFFQNRIFWLLHQLYCENHSRSSGHSTWIYIFEGL